MHSEEGGRYTHVEISISMITSKMLTFIIKRPWLGSAEMDHSETHYAILMPAHQRRTSERNVFTFGSEVRTESDTLTGGTS